MAPTLTKSQTNYREATGSQHCGNCTMFRRLKGSQGTCTLVKGDIHAFDTCDRWEPNEDT